MTSVLESSITTTKLAHQKHDQQSWRISTLHSIFHHRPRTWRTCAPTLAIKFQLVAWCPIGRRKTAQTRKRLRSCHSRLRYRFWWRSLRFQLQWRPQHHVGLQVQWQFSHRSQRSKSRRVHWRNHQHQLNWNPKLLRLSRRSSQSQRSSLQSREHHQDVSKRLQKLLIVSFQLVNSSAKIIGGRAMLEGLPHLKFDLVENTTHESWLIMKCSSEGAKRWRRSMISAQRSRRWSENLLIKWEDREF